MDDTGTPIRLGFDCRDARPSAVAGRWRPERRERFLLNPETPCPVSIDRSVLPSVFPEFNDIADEDCPAVAVVPADWESTIVARGWPDLDGMLCVLDNFGLVAPGSGFLLLEAELRLGPGMDADPLWSAMRLLSQKAPARPASGIASAARAFLGHDVADASGISALMNCGFQDDEAPDLRCAWAGRLNDHGLIASLDDALAFAALSDQRVKEHAPFAVYNLYGWDLFHKINS